MIKEYLLILNASKILLLIIIFITMNKIKFFVKGMMTLIVLGFFMGGLTVLFNACTKDSSLNEEQLIQLEEGRKWMQLFKNTTVTLPSTDDKLLEAVSAQANGWDLYDTFPSRPGMLRINTDNQYTQEYILTVKQEISPLVEQSIAYIESYGFTEMDFISTLGVGYDPSLVTEVAAVIQAAKNDGGVDFSMVNVCPFITKAYAGGTLERFGNCVVQSLIGIDLDVISQIQSVGHYLEVAGRKAILRMVGRFATRCLGWVGAAILVAEVGACMADNATPVLFTVEDWMKSQEYKLC